jgi:hypothetical protein
MQLLPQLQFEIPVKNRVCLGRRVINTPSVDLSTPRPRFPVDNLHEASTLDVDSCTITIYQPCNLIYMVV